MTDEQTTDLAARVADLELLVQGLMVARANAARSHNQTVKALVKTMDKHADLKRNYEALCRKLDVAMPEIAKRLDAAELGNNHDWLAEFGRRSLN